MGGGRAGIDGIDGVVDSGNLCKYDNGSSQKTAALLEGVMATLPP